MSYINLLTSKIFWYDNNCELINLEDAFIKLIDFENPENNTFTALNYTTEQSVFQNKLKMGWITVVIITVLIYNVTIFSDTGKDFGNTNVER